MDIETFSARQRSSFVNALMAAFPTYQALNLMLRLELNRPLAVATQPGPLAEVALALIDWAEAEGCLDGLIAGALHQKPNNPKLKAFGYAALLNVPSAERLEAIVRPNVPMQDPAGWRGRMERLEEAVCRIEMPEGDAAGSGFLIADDLVMTNCHVAAQMTARGAAARDCVARFGYRLSAGGDPNAGEPFKFAADWMADSSPVDALDYAVIRLAGPPGRTQVPAPRPHIFANGDVYFILQHPLGKEIKLSAGVFDRIEPASNRVSYSANTEPGSSGSPVFDIAWSPVALHHAGTTDRNTGVVLKTIGEAGKVPELWTQTP
jgi:hypothetical protein